MDGLRLRLYGAVSWVARGGNEAPLSKLPASIVLLLAEQHGRTVSVSTIIDRLWQEAPKSGANAVQRHVSKIRSGLRQLGVENPNQVIRSERGGYSLSASVATDYSLLMDGFQTGPDRAVMWWEEPLLGAAWEPHVGFRHQLLELAIGVVEGPFWNSTDSDQGADTGWRLRRLEQMLNHARHERRLHDAYLAAAKRLDDSHERATAATFIQAHPELFNEDDLQGRINRLMDDVGDGVSVDPSARQVFLSARDYENLVKTQDTLRRLLALWVAGRTDDALDHLDLVSDTLPPGLSTILYRWLLWLPIDDSGVRGQWVNLAADYVSIPKQAERALVSLDARCLGEIPDGQQIIDQQCSSETDRIQRLRALRTRYLLGLSQPHDERLDSITEEVANIGLADGRVEGTRFRFISALRRGDIDGAVRCLKEYEAVVGEDWRSFGDDFGPMARSTLRLSHCRQVLDRFGDDPSGDRIFAADREIVVVSEIVSWLLNPDDTTGTPTVDRFVIARNWLTKSASAGLDLLQLVRTGAFGEIDLDHTVDQLSRRVRDKQFSLLAVAAVEVAKVTGDRRLALAAYTAIKPWSGQMLGMWPVDYIFGPADTQLNALEDLI